MRLSLAIAASAAAALATSAGATAPKAQLAIEHTAPMVVLGQHFAKGEHVRVTVFVTTKTAARSVIASASGSFAVRFRLVSAVRCGPYGAHAVGSAGSKATVRVMPECAPGPTP